MEGPERNRTRHHCLGTLVKPLGYLSSGAKVIERIYTTSYFVA